MKIVARVKTIKEINESKIKLPKFQRDFAWTDDKIRKLAKSIRNKSPIGAITLFERDPHHEGNILIDGQQRITAIKKIIKNFKGYSIDSHEDRDKFYKYKIPIIYWKTSSNDKEESLVKWFQNINESGIPLDKEDIHLSLLSMIQIDRPFWFPKDYKEEINKMYKSKNSEMDIDSFNKIVITEVLYLLSNRIKGFVKNHDAYLMPKLINHNKIEYKIKRQLVWTKRILAIIFADNPNDVLTNKHKDFFDKKINKWLGIIDKNENNNNNYDLFSKKLSLVFEMFHHKFPFSAFPTNKSSIDSKRKGIFWDGGAKEYMMLYLLNFLRTNNELIINSNNSFNEFKKEYDNHQIRILDFINFLTKETISSGGFDNWVNILFKDQESSFLFWKDNSNIEKDNSQIERLFDDILSQSHSNKTIKKITKLVIFWLLEDKIEYRIKDKIEYYQFDHTIPKKQTGLLNNYSSLTNISILPHDQNGDKGSELSLNHFEKDWINEMIVEYIKDDVEANNDYNKIKKAIKEWENEKKIDAEEFKNYLNFREKYLKKIFIAKVKRTTK